MKKRTNVDAMPPRCWRAFRAKRGAGLFAWWLFVVMAAAFQPCPATLATPIGDARAAYLHVHAAGDCDRSAMHDPQHPRTQHCPDYLDQAYVAPDIQMLVTEVGFTSFVTYPVDAISVVRSAAFSPADIRARQYSPLPAPDIFGRVPRLLI